MKQRFWPLIVVALVVSFQTAQGAPIYWDGTTNPGDWGTPANWSTDTANPALDPASAPGAADVATFTIDGIATAQTVNMNGTQSALGLATRAQTAITTIQGGGTNQTLNLGTSGINHVAGGLVVGSTTAGQQVAISLQGAQSWTSSASGTGAAGLQVRNDVSIGAGGNQTLTLTGTNVSPSIGGIISDGAGVLSILKNSTSAWTLSGANSYTGTTTVSGGTLRIQNASGLGHTSGATNVTSGQVELTNGITVTGESITLAGGGNNSGALQATSGSTATWAGPVTLGSSVRIGGGGGGSSLTLTGPITGANPVFISVANGSGSVTFSAAAGNNTYSGNTSLIRGTLKLGADNTLPTGTIVDVAQTTAADQSTFDLNGFNQTIGGLQHSGDTTNGNATVTNSAAGPVKTLTINQAGTSSYGTKSNSTGVITGNLALIKSGAGSLTLTGANSYTGGTTLSGGVLAASVNSAFGAGDVTVQSTATRLALNTGVSNAIADAALLALDGGGTAGTADVGYLDLTSGANETVGNLTLGGIVQPAGTYGSTASLATFQSDEYFSGTGIVTNLAVPEPGTIGLFAAAALLSLARRRR